MPQFGWRIAPSLVAALAVGASLPGKAAAATTPLVSQASNTCLDVPASNATPGTRVEIWSCNGGSNQQWEFTAAGELRALGGTRCLDASGGGTSAGTPVISYTCNGAPNQKWTLTNSGQIVGSSGLCLDVTGGATADGTLVELWSCNGGGNQAWSKDAHTIPTSNNPDFGPNVQIFDASSAPSAIQGAIDAAFNSENLSATAQFGSKRWAFLFKPGATYSVWANLGFYMSLIGLGQHPDDVTINGAVNVDSGWNLGDETNATQNFWRSVENLAVIPQGGTDRWAVSQAAPMRRVHIKGDLVLGPSNQGNPTGYASGGYIADTKVDGLIASGSQQQWYTRDSTVSHFYDGVWNMVFSGVHGGPAQSFPAPPYTSLATTPVSREKPFLYYDTSAKGYAVFVPALRTNASGTSWESGSTAGTSIPMSQFYVAKPSDSAATINAALQQGLNIFFTPGVYQLNDTIRVTRANTVILGIGFPTLQPNNGVDGLSVADVDGVKIAGLLFDAGTANSNNLLLIGAAGSSASHAGNPISVQDVYFRVGGGVAGKATNSLVVNANDTLIDHIWAWRADHGAVATGWTINTGANGLVVNGNNVLATGLFVEHYQQYNVLWNGQNGKTIFFQNELPYDPPSQSAWRSGATGYPAYKVADNVTSHEAWGVGSYCFFNLDPSIHEAHSFEAPTNGGVKFHDALTVSLGGVGTIDHVINNAGGAAQGTSTVPVNVLSFP